MSGRIDIHSHLLPGVDDGCKTVADSLDCARALVEQQQISKCPADIDAEAATHIIPCVGRFETACSPKPGPIPLLSPLPQGPRRTARN